MRKKIKMTVRLTGKDFELIAKQAKKYKITNAEMLRKMIEYWRRTG